MSGKLLIVIGSGPGIGSATATHFASKGFDVALLSRNAERLEKEANAVRSAAGKDVKINSYPVDASDHNALRATLDKVKDEMGLPEVLHFNAARVAQSDFGEIPIERLTEDYNLMTIGLYICATWSFPLFEELKTKNPDSRPSFLITGGGLYKYPNSAVFALGIQKAAQANFAGSLQQIAKPKGIHVAYISVNGLVKDENEVINAKNIATTFWKVYEQDKWEWEGDQGIHNVGRIEDAA